MYKISNYENEMYKISNYEKYFESKVILNSLIGLTQTNI